MKYPREAQQWCLTGTLVATGSYNETEMEKQPDDVVCRGARLLALMG